jgi:hypothetical protein
VLPEIKRTDPRSEQFEARAKVVKDRVELMRLGEALARAKESAAAGVLDRLTGLVRSWRLSGSGAAPRRSGRE